MTRIHVTDPRLTAIAASSLDVEVAIDPIPAPTPVNPGGGALSVRRDAGKAWFTVGGSGKSEAVEVSVHIENETLVFFPQRSSAHRQLLAKLGIDE